MEIEHYILSSMNRSDEAKETHYTKKRRNYMKKAKPKKKAQKPKLNKEETQTRGSRRW